jgi:hypothetical protein
VRDRGAEVTQEERVAIDELLVYETLADRYQPFRSDNVKGGIRQTATPETYRRYFNAWWHMALKHPIVYLEATVANSYAYFDPYARLPILPLCQFNTQPEPEKWIDKMNLQLNQLSAFSGARAFLESAYGVFRKLPIAGLLVSMGAYTLILMAMIAFLIAKRRGSLLIGLIPAIMTVLSCVASPVNGMLRYFLPVMALAPAAVLGILSGYGNRFSPEDRT